MSPTEVRWTAFTLIAVVAGYAVCSECPTEDNESILQAGHKYLYRFKSEALTEAVGTTDERGRITIECGVEISHLHDCYFRLLMQDCSYSAAHGPPNAESTIRKGEAIPELSKYPIQFSLVNGEITQVYRDDSDPIYFVNIKRGVLSTFVYKLSGGKNQMVTDIHGTCPTEIVRESNGVMKTSKDMLHCAYPSRPDWQLSPWSMFWNMSFIQYVINSTLNCEYKISSPERQLDSIFCKERHAIMLESTHLTTTAVQTNVYYRMGLVEVKKVKSSGKKVALLNTETGIAYEYLPTPDPNAESEPTDFLPLAKTLLSELVEISREEMRLHAIPKFTDFVALLRKSPNLDTFVESVTSCSFWQKSDACSDDIKELSMAYLSDALVQCQTVPCFDAILKLVEQDALSDVYFNFVMYSWNNMHFTKPEIIKRVMAMCDAKESRFCWLTFGTLLRKYHERTYASSEDKATEVKHGVNHLANAIGDNCDPGITFLSKQQKNEHILTYLRAIGNAGDAFIKYKSRGVRRLLKCVERADLPMVIRTAALEIMQQMDVCSHSISQCHLIHDGLGPVLQDSSADPSLRIGAYNLLMQGPQQYDFQTELLSLLKSEKNSQVLSYIAGDLIHRMKDSEYVQKFTYFVSQLRNNLKRDSVVLENLQSFEEGKSESEKYGHFTKFQFLPEELQGFGIKEYSSYIYSFYSRLPQRFKTNIIVKLFNKVIDLLAVGGNIEGWHDIGLIITKFFETLDDDDKTMTEEEISSYALKVMQLFAEQGNEVQNDFKFDPTVIKNIRDIYTNFHRRKFATFPIIQMYLQMFGSTLSFVTSDDVLAGVNYVMQDFQLFLSKLPDGIIYNNTRVIRVIEAFHQVPTMMGLPLNWTTDATLAFSLRSGMQLNFRDDKSLTQDIEGKAFLHPSVALTFLNRMILDFPTFVKFGVQANSSGYTSTQFGVSVDLNDNSKTIKFDAPSRPQKILELFRTNQLIRDDITEDISPWHYERTSTSWCTKDELNSATGFQICHERSYPNVTHLIKPWALMTGSCLWRLELLPYDSALKSYNFYLINVPSEGYQYQLKLKFDAPGEKSESGREVVADVSIDFKTGSGKAEMHIIALPDFLISVSRNNQFQNEKHTAILDSLLLKLSHSLQYRLSHNYETTMEKRKEESGSDNITSKSKRIATVVHRSIKLETPFNVYSWTRKTQLQDRSVKVDVLLAFENLNPEWNFMSQILPSTLWESRSKAYVRFLLNHKGLSKKSKDVLTSNLDGQVITPKSNIKLSSNTLMMSGRYQIIANLTKSYSSTGKVRSFVNFTYDLWNSAFGENSVKEIRIVNLTIPRKSWSFEMKKVIEDRKQQYNVAFIRARMVPIDDSAVMEDYVGWWSEDVKDRFALQQQDFTVTADIEDRYPDESQLLAEFDNVKEEEIKGLRTLYRLADVQFFYPFGSQQENIKFNGKFLLSSAQTIFRFQKDFTLISSYNNLKLTSHSVYRSEQGKSRELAHNSYFTHTTSETQAFYNMDFKQGVNNKGCHQIHFNHNITSHVYNMASNVNYFCYSEDPNKHSLVLNLDSHSQYWQMLDMKIRQIVKDISHDLTEESMNFTNPNMFINVNAEWRGNNHKKVAIFNQVGIDHPVMEITIHSTRPLDYMVEVILPNGERKDKMYYNRMLSSDRKKLDVYFYFPNHSHPVFHVHGNILNPERRVWKLELFPGLSRFSGFIGGVLNKAVMSLKTIADDEFHPLNRMLEPALKMPLSQYLYELGQDIKIAMHRSSENVKEAMLSLKPFYESPVEIIRNTYNAVSSQVKALYSVVEKKSIAIWAVKYFEVPQMLHGLLANIPGPLSLFQRWIYANYKEEHPDHPMKTLYFHSSKLLVWRDFTEMPLLNLNYIRQLLPDALSKISQTIQPFHQPERESKIAMVFGPRHVYTFDGLLYEFPVYPSENCLYLLTHDAYSSKFSAIISSDYIHLLFPEVTLSINSKDEIFVDNNLATITPLPFETSNRTVSVRREGNVLKVTSPSLTVLCEGRSFLCTIELSGWNGGGTYGLLGNSDGETYNEFLLPDGHVTSDVTKFAKSYELSGNSKCKELKVAEKPSHTNAHKEQCMKSLQKICTSYDHLQKSFLESCLTYLVEENNICYTEAALAALCYHKGQPLDTTCNVQTQEKAETRHKLQVVLVVSQHQNMLKDKDLQKGIESVVEAVQEQFSSHGYSTIHFSLVGYGGSGVRYKPSVHAVESNIWLTHKKTVSQLLSTLEFSGTKEISPVVAVKYAAEVLGHDTFDTKIMIVITDVDKLTSKKTFMQLVQNYLDKNHITLYTIASYPSIAKGKKVFGIRADGLIFPSLKKGGDFMDYPRGDLAKLTSGTRGSLFLKKFLDSNEPESYFTEFAQEVWAKVRKEVGYCRSCKNIQSGWWYFQNECHLVNCSS